MDNENDQIQILGMKDGEEIQMNVQKIISVKSKK